MTREHKLHMLAREGAVTMAKVLKEAAGKYAPPEDLMLHMFLVAAVKLTPGLGDQSDEVSDEAVAKLMGIMTVVIQAEIYARATGREPTWPR